jgi:hypothetical protein
METMTDLPRPWMYAVEITGESCSLAELSQRTRNHFRVRGDEHEIALEASARIVVRFTSLDAASRFYFNEGGRFVKLPYAPFDAPESPIDPAF